MTTNYTSTFIQVADDCPVGSAEVPPGLDEPTTVAALQYALIAAQPYELTSDDVLFEVFAARQGIAPRDRDARRAEFFAKDQACLRASPLGKRYGWGIHHDHDARVALVALGSREYEELATDGSLRQLKAMRSRREH